MVGKAFAVLLVVLLVGCGASDETSVAPVTEKSDVTDVPPAEMRTILEGLRSDNPRMQYAALQTLSRFPSVVQAHREHVERLQQASKDQRVRQKAAELLASLKE